MDKKATFNKYKITGLSVRELIVCGDVLDSWQDIQSKQPVEHQYDIVAVNIWYNNKKYL